MPNILLSAIKNNKENTYLEDIEIFFIRQTYKIALKNNYQRHGLMTIEIPLDKVLYLIKQALTEREGKVILQKTRILDRKGPANLSEDMLRQDNVKSYIGQAIIYLKIVENKPIFDWELPEHDNHRGGGRV